MSNSSQQITKKNSWGSLLQTASTITEKEQLHCHSHNDTICQVILMPFHHQEQGDSRNVNYANSAQKLLLDILFSPITK